MEGDGKLGMKIYIDGRFYDEKNAKISVLDHGLLYGDGVFEGIRLYDGCLFRLDDHLERLYSSAKYIMLKIPLNLAKLKEAVVQTVRRNKLTDGYIRLVITRGKGTLGLAPWLCPKASVIIIADKIKLYPEECYTKGLDLVTAPTRQNAVESLSPRVKSLNYLNNILAKIEAHNAGCLEALMLDAQGYVSECTGDNIFIIKKGRLVTTPIYIGILRGITRDVIIEIAREMDHEVLESTFTRFDIMDADECFLTGTAAEAIPVVSLDKRKIGNGKPGKITKKLITEFRKRTATDGTMVQ